MVFTFAHRDAVDTVSTGLHRYGFFISFVWASLVGVWDLHSCTGWGTEHGIAFAFI